MKRVFLASLVAAGLLGFICAGPGQAADFTAWTTIWLQARVVESGYAAPVLPGGGKVTRDHERDANVFVEFTSCDATAATCEVDVCTFDFTTQAWTLQTDLTIPILGGGALDFLTLLDYTYTEETGVTEEFVLPLRVKGRTANAESNVLKGASFTSLGGYYRETFTAPAAVGVGAITFNGNMIPASQVATKVPAVCTGD